MTSSLWLSGAASGGDSRAAPLPVLRRFAESAWLGESGELRRPNTPPGMPLTPVAGALPLPTLRMKESGSMLEAIPQVRDAAHLRERLLQCISTRLPVVPTCSAQKSWDWRVHQLQRLQSAHCRAADLPCRQASDSMLLSHFHPLFLCL